MEINEAQVHKIVEDYYNCIDMSLKKLLGMNLSLAALTTVSVEAQLEGLKQSPDILELAKIAIVKESTGVMPKFFYLSVFEEKRLWNRRTFTEQQVIENRGYLWSLLTSGKLANAFLITKLAKIVIVFAKHEYPTHWPNFVNDLYQLHQISLNLALIMIKTIAEVLFVKGRPIAPQLSSEMQNTVMPLIWNTLKWGYPEISGSAGQKFINHPASPKKKEYFIPSPTEGSLSNPDQIRETISSAMEALEEIVQACSFDEIFWIDTSLEILLVYSVIDVPDCEFATSAVTILADVLSLAKLSTQAAKYLPFIFQSLGNILEINVRRHDELGDQ